MMREKLEALAKDIGPDIGMFIAQWAAQQEMGVEQEALSTLVVRRVREKLRAILAAEPEPALLDVVAMESDAQTLRGYINTYGETPAMTWSNREHWKNRAERAEAAIDKLKMDAEHLQYERDEAREKLAAAESLNVYFRDAIGECHLMISRKTFEYQVRKEWECTDLPPRLQTVMKRIAELELALSAETSGLLERAELAEHDRDEWEKKDVSSRESLHSEMIRAERAEADIEKLKMDAEHLQYERDEARETNVRLVAALVAIEDHHGETEDWRDIARSALAEARKEKV